MVKFVLVIFMHVYSGDMAVRIGLYNRHDQCVAQGIAYLAEDMSASSRHFMCVPVNGD